MDYSEYHDVRVDNQFATDTLVPDVVQLQTLQDLTRWKEQGRPLPYKPAGFSQVYDGFKDPHGAWVAIGAIGFSFLYDVRFARGSNSPGDAVGTGQKAIGASVSAGYRPRPVEPSFTPATAR